MDRLRHACLGLAAAFLCSYGLVCAAEEPACSVEIPNLGLSDCGTNSTLIFQPEVQQYSLNQLNQQIDDLVARATAQQNSALCTEFSAVEQAGRQCTLLASTIDFISLSQVMVNYGRFMIWMNGSDYVLVMDDPLVPPEERRGIKISSLMREALEMIRVGNIMLEQLQLDKKLRKQLAE